MLLILAALLGTVVLAHTAPFPFLLEPFRPARSLWQVKSPPGAPPTIYLTFDDGPSAEWTPPLLDALEETGVTATFFLIDEHITPQTEPIVRRIAEDGHAIGLHSGDRWLMTLEADAVAATLQGAADRIEAITGEEPCRLFRPHGGWRSASLYAGLRKVGYTLAGWSWGMWDWHWWQEPRARDIASRLARRASAGDVVVIHDGHHENPRADRRHAAETVRLLAPMLGERGFRFGALCGTGPGAGVGLR
jgi:peptidoglycan-N-acetylglucosamine deacetylase